MPQRSQPNEDGNTLKDLLAAAGALPCNVVYTANLNHKNGDPSRSPSSKYARYHDYANAMRNGPGRGVSTFCTGIVSGDANIAATDFPNLQQSVAAKSFPAVVFVQSKDPPHCICSYLDSVALKTPEKENVQPMLFHVMVITKISFFGVEIREDTNRLPSSAVKNDFSSIHHNYSENVSLLKILLRPEFIVVCQTSVGKTLAEPACDHKWFKWLHLDGKIRPAFCSLIKRCRTRWSCYAR